MDEGSFDVENSRLQIKKLKEKVKSLVSEVDLSREIRSDEFSKSSKFEPESSVFDISSELALSDEDSDEFLEFTEADFSNETTWLLDRNGNYGLGTESSKDLFNALYAEVDEFHADITDLYCELQLLRNSSSSSIDSNKSNKRSSLIDSRTFTRPKKYSSRPPLTSIVSNCSEEIRTPGKVQRRLTTTVSPNPNIISKLEELSKGNNRPGDGYWEEGSEEGLADIENTSRKNKRKSLPESMMDRLQELKRSNNLYINSRIADRSSGRQSVLSNGNVEESDRSKVSEDAKKVKAAFDLNVKNALSTSCMSDIFKNIPEYLSDDNESFFSLDDVSGFCDRLTLSTDPSTYSSIVREMEQNEICFYHSATPLEDTPMNRMTFGGREIPPGMDLKPTMNTSNGPLIEIEDELNTTYEVLPEPESNVNTTFEIRKRESLSKLNTTYDAEKKPSLVDVILQSDIIKSLNPGYEYKNCDNRIANNNEKLNETYTQNELNKMHTEKYTTKVFDASFKKASPPSERPNGRKEGSDHSEDDCMSTTSDTSYRSVDSNSELKNIEELKNIAMQQSKKLSDVKFSTPKLESSKPTYSRNSDEFRHFSPIRRDIGDGESQASSNASSRGPSPRGGLPTSGSDTMQRSRAFSVRQPPKVPQRELKLKPALIRPSQNFKRMISNGKSSTESLPVPKIEHRNSSSSGLSIVRPSAHSPTSGMSSGSSSKPITKASGIPRPPSRLKPPQIRAAEVYKK